MIKELILAILLGGLLGFGLTGAFFTLKKTTRPVSNPVVISTPTPLPSTSPAPTSTVQKTDNDLSIDSPENESLVNSPKVTVSGSTLPNSFIIIQSPLKSYYLSADSTGKFSAEIDLETGVNIITIDSVSPTDTQTGTQLTITYSTAKI